MSNVIVIHFFMHVDAIFDRSSLIVLDQHSRNCISWNTLEDIWMISVSSSVKENIATDAKLALFHFFVLFVNKVDIFHSRSRSIYRYSTRINIQYILVFRYVGIIIRYMFDAIYTYRLSGWYRGLPLSFFDSSQWFWYRILVSNLNIRKLFKSNVFHISLLEWASFAIAYSYALQFVPKRNQNIKEWDSDVK